MNNETLETSIQDFNEWEGSAKIYFNKEEGYFFTEVFHNDIQAVQTVPAENVYAIISKKETQGNFRIGEKRKSYIKKMAEKLLDGLDYAQATYDLAEEAYRLGI
jgi:hypothetical protein